MKDNSFPFIKAKYPKRKHTHKLKKKIITHLSSYPPNDYRKGDRYVDKTSLVTRKNLHIRKITIKMILK